MNDQHNVNIVLNSTIERDGISEETKLYIQGKFFIKGDTYYLRYKEEVEDLGHIDHTIRVKRDEALVLRKGSIEMRQPMKVGESREGSYKSPFGAMQTLVEADCCDIQWIDEKGEGLITLRYFLYMQGAPFGRVTLIFQMKKQSLEQ